MQLFSLFTLKTKILFKKEMTMKYKIVWQNSKCTENKIYSEIFSVHRWAFGQRISHKNAKKVSKKQYLGKNRLNFLKHKIHL